MKFVLEIDTDNAAFADDVNCEVSRILRQAAEGVELGQVPFSGERKRLRDINGNTVGFVAYETGDNNG